MQFSCTCTTAVPAVRMPAVLHTASQHSKRSATATEIAFPSVCL